MPTPRSRNAENAGVDLHPVKQETFDVQAGTNTDPKGFLRQVDRYEETAFGLYMARGADHPRFGYLESWLLPSLGLRANIFHFRPHVDVDQELYIDVADISKNGDVWSTRDLYVDLVATTGRPIEVLDIDELAAATSAHLIPASDAERAIECTLAAVEGITRCGDDANRWFASQGMNLTWAPEITLTPPPGSTQQ